MRSARPFVLALWLAGCAGDAGVASPTAPHAATDTPTTAPSRDDAIEQLTDRLIRGMMAEPPGWPSKSDYELVVLPFYHDRPDFVDEALADFDHYASVYTASECLAGQETTPSGFRQFVAETFAPGRDRLAKVASAAEDVIAGILARAAKDAPSCLIFYNAPGTAVNAIAAIHLARPIVAANRPGLLPWQVDAELRMIALSWFGRGQPFFEWACTHEDVCKLGKSPPQGTQR